VLTPENPTSSVSDGLGGRAASTQSMDELSDFYICPSEQRQTAAYHRQPVPRHTAAEWIDLAREVTIDVLQTEHAVTARELEARAGDRTWNPSVCPSPIQPHLLTTAVQELVAEGIIQRTTETTRGGNNNQGVEVTTLSLASPPSKRAVEAAAARKRILTSRHNGWATRNLIGRPGEEAMVQALHEAGCFAAIQQNITEMFGARLVGEIDCSCVHVDTTDGLTPVLILGEVKNTREWYYDDSINEGNALRRLLRKAAALQWSNPNVLIAPLFILRHGHQTLVRTGERDGFMVASTHVQLIKSDTKLDKANFEEVRDELGYLDMRLDVGTTNYHRGIAKKMIPNNARATAERWADGHRRYLNNSDILF
ncbi:MAG: hypothetical protein ABMA25_00695, partial [Ilumatobacteraceae bacterium]